MRHPKADGKLLCVCMACLPARLLWMVRGWPAVSIWSSFSKAVQFLIEYPSLLHGYQPSGSRADKEALGNGKGGVPPIRCVEFSLILLFPASHHTLIAGCPRSAERLCLIFPEKLPNWSPCFCPCLQSLFNIELEGSILGGQTQTSVHYNHRLHVHWQEALPDGHAVWIRSLSFPVSLGSNPSISFIYCRFWISA